MIKSQGKARADGIYRASFYVELHVSRHNGRVVLKYLRTGEEIVIRDFITVGNRSPESSKIPASDGS